MFEFIKNISPTELGIIVVILIILFGSKLIIGLARTSGETVKEIKKIKKTSILSRMFKHKISALIQRVPSKQI